MFAVLGEIVFAVLTSPTAFESARRFDFAEHRVVEDRPRLQWLAEDLETIRLDIAFHVAFTNPGAQLNLLVAAAEDHAARALVFGNGVHRGYFVISELQEMHRQNADDGSLIYATARVVLREYALGAEMDPLAPPRPDFLPPGIITATGGSASWGTPTAFDPSAAPGLGNLLPANAVVSLDSLPTEIYNPPIYNAPGVSPIVNNTGAAPLSSVRPGDLPAAQLTGSR